MASTAPNSSVIYAPHPNTHPGKKSVFLAGSIEMGRAVDWQSGLAASLSHLPVAVLNPRRPDWGQGWPQDISFAPFREQVEWELDMQESADIIAMYFSPETMSPVSLLELGLFARTGKMLVACPVGFWRRGNVQVVCQRFDIALLGSLEELTEAVAARFGELGVSKNADHEAT